MLKNNGWQPIEPLSLSPYECRGPPSFTLTVHAPVLLREVSLAGLPRSGRGIDECYALLFESAFDLAES